LSADDQKEKYGLIRPVTDGRRLWLRVGTLLDGGIAAPLRNAHVVYDRNSILYVGQDSPPRNLLTPDQTQPDCDLPDFTLLP